MKEQDLAETINWLNSHDLDRVAIALKNLAEAPLMDNRILPYLERLIKDKTPCLIQIPFLYGEISWLAAQALAAERTALNIAEPLHIPAVVVPISGTDLHYMASQLGVTSTAGSIKGSLEIFEKLRSLGKLPLFDLNYSP